MQGKTCAELKSNQDTYLQLQDDMEHEEYRIANQYNITVDDIYSDFIADGNTQLQADAIYIVEQLQASYAYRAKLETEYPDALFHVVTIRTEDNNGEDIIIRQSEVLWGDKYWGKSDVLNPTDLSQAIRTISQTTEDNSVIDDMQYYHGLQCESEYDGSNPHCNRTERIKIPSIRMFQRKE
ncbi:hypothetical protein HC723_02820 [Vibrio sp. S11_S32]|uniref:hypothetical protein n=1 Tax=Vibrio sp. S11_S32 TaxID=2720225 RepID=UPI0016810E3A|nr:hypothetical protein [Vibrio sp. S11_S32]MBD1575387.1 hypothetical protein [Vibrio sp. S11_S32]